MSIALDITVKGRFFDRAAVLKEISVRERRALSRMGAFIRQRAKTDVLRRTLPYGHRRKVGRGRDGKFKRIRQSGNPGGPPIVHSRDPNNSLRKILFALGSDGQSVIVGPVKLNQKGQFTMTRLTVPELLEFGGTVGVREYRYRGSQQWLPGKPRRRRGADEIETRTRRAKYSPHPFMAEALNREARAGHLVDAFAYGVT